MSEPLTDQRLGELQRLGGPRAAADPAVLALLTDVVARYPRAKIHWLTDTPEAIRNDWYAKRLHAGRLASMIDQAGSVAHLRRLAAGDLYQYAVDQRRPELSARLFERLDTLLRSDPDRFMVMVPPPTAAPPGGRSPRARPGRCSPTATPSSGRWCWPSA